MIIFWLVFRKLVGFGIFDCFLFGNIFCGWNVVVFLCGLKGVVLSMLIICFGRWDFFGLSLGK